MAKQGFPDDRDRQLQHDAEQVWELADELVEWAGRYAPKRKQTDFELRSDEEFALYRMRRLASNLCRSAAVPVAAAMYGPSQVGKSLFIGRVLEPADPEYTPLGKDDQFPPPAYIRELSFNVDLNPQTGGKEATALVTRFTTKERFDETALAEYPVKVRALTRAEWLRVLARGFRSECKQTLSTTWREAQLRDLFEETSRESAADAVDGEWRMDLLDVYAYLRSIDPRQYEATESMFNAFLSQYPLTDAGYVKLAGRMFWDSENFPALTAMFNDVCRFLKRITAHGRDGILVHWAAVRFLLDSKRKEIHRAPNLDSKWQQEVAWKDLADSFKDGWYVIDYQPGGQGPTEPLTVIQSALMEMIVPVVPHRLKEDWRDVILKMDLLDLPGMRAGGADSQGGAEKIDKVEQMMNIIIRGKVFYLIDRYIEERQVQTLLLLIRGFNLEVRSLLKEYLDKWGRARYGDDVWPRRVAASAPSLFIGMTGIDEQFSNVEASKDVYDARLGELVNDTLYEIMTDFGGPGQPFTNVYPLRYPGTWDADEKRRKASGDAAKWDRAGKCFSVSEMVRRYVRNPEEKWEAAMRDDDGGQSLLSRGFINCTTATQKQDALEQQIKRVRLDLKNLAERWYCSPDANKDRELRGAVGKQVTQWLEDAEHVYHRVRSLSDSLCFDEGDAMEVAEFSERRSGRTMPRPKGWEELFADFLKEFLGRWARELATKRWRDCLAAGNGNLAGLSADDFGVFVRYLGDYLCCSAVFGDLKEKLRSVIALPILDEGDRRYARREYVRVILNDYVLNPGPNESVEEAGPASGDRDYGLMTPFVSRMQARLSTALACAAGEHVQIPPGNDDLGQILGRY